MDEPTPDPFGLINLLRAIVRTCEAVAATKETSLVYMVFEDKEDRVPPTGKVEEMLRHVMFNGPQKDFLNAYAECLTESICALLEAPDDLEYADIAAAEAIPELYDQWGFVKREEAKE